MRSAVFSPDGEYVLTASEDKTAVIFDCEYVQYLAPLPQTPNTHKHVHIYSAYLTTPHPLLFLRLSDENSTLWL